MHYKDGREVKLGDVVKVPHSDGTGGYNLGVVVQKNGLHQTCNIQYQPAIKVTKSGDESHSALVSSDSPWSATAVDCEFVG